MTLSELHYEKTTDYAPKFMVRESPDDNTEDNRESKNIKSAPLKRIPLEKLMDLKVDYAFKQLFGIEKNKNITVVFLNAILQRTGQNRIRDISFANTETGGEYVDDKQSRLDLLVCTEAGEWINVEIQFSNKYNMIKRSLFYWSRTYLARHEKGMDYNKLRPVIAINILNFDLFHQTENFHTTYHLYEDEAKFQLTDMMEFHFIEMGKLIKDWKANKLDPWNDVLARWLLMLGIVDHRNRKIHEDIYRELEVIFMEDESLRDAFQNWEELSMTQEQRMAYESRLKTILDDEAFKNRMKAEAQEIENKKTEVEKTKAEMEQTKAEMEEAKTAVIQIRKEGKQLKNEGLQLKEEADQKIGEAREKEKKAEQRLEKIARQLLSKGLDMDFVVESTGLTWDRVVEIQDTMKK